MFKLKTLLLLSILPLAYLIYHLIGFENGINAYVHKIKVLKNKQIHQEELKKEIDYYLFTFSLMHLLKSTQLI